ncbi:MAG: peptidoglycan-associated lipoprotein Pal [Burkholderiaceae bacterium]
MKRIFLAAAFSIALAGCGSAVKLDDVSVEDKSGTPVGMQALAGPVPASTSAALSRSAIAPIEVGSKAGTGAAGAAGAATAAAARTVFFDFDSFAIKPEFQVVVDTQAKLIKADKNRKVMIEGHTDESGGREYNLALGQKRSEAVRRALVLLGVADSQIEAVSFGKEKPAAQGTDEMAMAKNRRAEISYR